MSRLYAPRSMTPEKLRDIADWLDIYDNPAEQYIKHFAYEDEQLELLDAVRGKEVQEDLRDWADSIEAQQQRSERLSRACGQDGCDCKDRS